MKKVIAALAAIVVTVLAGCSTTPDTPECVGACAPDSEYPAMPTPGGFECLSNCPKPKFSERISTSNVVNPATLYFEAPVKNTGDLPGRARCFVYFSDPSHAYEGYDSFSTDKIKPGERYLLSGYITVTNEGAMYAGRSWAGRSIRCKPTQAS